MSNGKPVGRKIDGQMLSLYTIENGRHRIAKALAEGRTEINAKIIEQKVNVSGKITDQ